MASDTCRSPGNVPVAAYDGVGPVQDPALTNRNILSPEWPALPSRIPPPSLTMATNASHEPQEASTGARTRGDATDNDDLPPSSLLSSFASTQGGLQPPLAQARVAWADVNFQRMNAPFVPTPASLSHDHSLSPAPSTFPPPTALIQSAPDDDAGRAPSQDEGWKVVPHSRKRGREDELNGPNQRRRTRKQDVRSVGVDTRSVMLPAQGCPDALRSGQMAPVSSGSSTQSAVVTPTPVRGPRTALLYQPQTAQLARDNGQVNPSSLGRSQKSTQLSVLPGALMNENMEVDEASQQVQPTPGGSAPSHAHPQNSGSVMDLPLRESSVSSPFTFQFDLRTPRQTHDAMARPLARIPVREPPPPPIAGPYTTREIAQTGADRLPPFVELERAVDGARARDAAVPTLLQQRRPLADITPEDAPEGPRNVNQENIPPPYRREPSRGLTFTRDQSRGFSIPRDAEPGTMDHRSHAPPLMMAPALPASGSRVRSNQPTQPMMPQTGRAGQFGPLPLPSRIRLNVECRTTKVGVATDCAGG
ncbi:hypothetical protein K466DRAFT_600410 [Polyporus arcularius HHB13444]|uniref:Uncharacterized protein n=1 Tax=Polyporus arcularius HHB13444 TaxID=1314778 RepID=A0A5C3P9H8_9APHY|nr:hypothetical protein K466DRAFT_600410 [Polyporus arcularius HHB13444]